MTNSDVMHAVVLDLLLMTRVMLTFASTCKDTQCMLPLRSLHVTFLVGYCRIYTFHKTGICDMQVPVSCLCFGVLYTPRRLLSCAQQTSIRLGQLAMLKLNAAFAWRTL